MGRLHDLPPRQVHVSESGSLLRNLLHDLLRSKNWLEVNPLGLALQPLVQDVLQKQQSLLPRVQPVLEWNSKRTSSHGLGLHDVVIQEGLGLVNWASLKDVGSRLLPIRGIEGDAVPLLVHLVQSLLQGPLPARKVADLLNLLVVHRDLAVKKSAEASGLVLLDLKSYNLRKLRPVARAEPLVANGRH